MANEENEVVDDLQQIPEVPEGEEDTTDWKSLAQKNYGIAQRYKTKFEKSKEVKPEAKPEEPKSQDKKEFDLAEKSYLLANGIKKSDISLVWDEMSKSGKSIDEILESPYFKEKLEMSATKDAIPSGTKRTSGSARDDVEYWIQKGEFPPMDQVELRRKVVNALSQKHSNKTKFSPNPIA
jgi:hypothetical protein